jgi:predicted SnoaL-like aldol condensation-catalyzing enzyme
MQSTIEQNKAAVVRFNKEFIEQGNMNSFKELVADDVINHAAPPGAPNGPESMIHFILNILRNGFSDIKIDILDQVAEGDKVTTRKAIHAVHTGEFMGVSASNKKVTIHVIDIIRLRNGQYIEHWGLSNIPQVIAEISEK